MDTGARFRMSFDSVRRYPSRHNERRYASYLSPVTGGARSMAQSRS